VTALCLVLEHKSAKLDFNFDAKRTCTTGKCRDPTLRVMSKDTECDKHIIKVAEPSPAVTVVNLSTRGLDDIIVTIPSDQPQNMGE